MYIENDNRRAKPFIRTKTADELLGKINTSAINNMQH